MNGSMFLDVILSRFRVTTQNRLEIDCLGGGGVGGGGV